LPATTSHSPDNRQSGMDADTDSELNILLALQTGLECFHRGEHT
jgi:hypothetical protein